MDSEVSVQIFLKQLEALKLRYFVLSTLFNERAYLSFLTNFLCHYNEFFQAGFFENSPLLILPQVGFFAMPKAITIVVSKTIFCKVEREIFFSLVFFCNQPRIECASVRKAKWTFSPLRLSIDTIKVLLCYCCLYCSQKSFAHI